MKAILVFFVAGLMFLATQADAARILLIAGRQSHGPGDHEFRAGMLLIQRSLNSLPGVQALVASNGWPTDASAFEVSRRSPFTPTAGQGIRRSSRNG